MTYGDDLIKMAVSEAPEPSEIADRKIKQNTQYGEFGNVSSEPNASGFQRASSGSGEDTTEKTGFIRDSNGEQFDPGKHAADDRGRPKFTKTGKFRKKRGANFGPTRPVEATTERAIAYQLGHASAEAVFMLGGIVFGEDGAPEKDEETGEDERKQMQDAWASYYLLTGKTDIPPGLAIAMVCSVYAARRIPRPKVQSRFKRFTNWIKLKIAERKINRESEDK